MIVFKGGTASFDNDHETFVSIYVHVEHVLQGSLVQFRVHAYACLR